MKEITVYHYVNGEEKVAILKKAIRFTISSNEPTLEYVCCSNETGKMKVKVYIFDDEVVVYKQWVPNPGYAWEEEKITLIKLKSPSD